MLRKLLINTSLVLLCVCVCGCGIKPYTADVQQGNVFDQSTVNQLRLGMTKSAVCDLLGTPVLGNSVAADDWTYIYTNQVNGGKMLIRHVHLKFASNKLIEIKLR